MHFGVHAGLQNTTTAELQSLWRRIEDHGFEWISVWDHFYAADASISKDGSVHSGYQCLEALTTHAALALSTTKVQCGSLVYCAGYRNPAVLAKSIATIDQLSGGRVVLGLGGGWHQGEYHAYGIPFPSVGERLRILDEAIQCVRLLFTEEVANFEGEHFQLRDARLEPKPLQERLPLVVGGGGEKVTLRIAAQHADGWNLAFTSPETYRHKAEALAGHCEKFDRDPSTIAKSVNLALAWKEEDLVRQFGGTAEFIGANALKGSPQQVVDRIGEYRDAGADMVILALRAPFDVDGLDRFAAEVFPGVLLDRGVSDDLRGSPSGMSMAAELVLHLERVLPAPRELVFRMHTEPELLAQWWGPKGFTAPSVELDVRVGGRYRIVMQPSEGDSFMLSGEFREVDPGSRLVYTFRWEPPDPDDRETVVVVSLRNRGASTALTVDQERFATDARRALHEQGWTESLDRLEMLITVNASSTVERLVGVYDADGTVLGELSYFLRARIGRAHCALCDVTHGRIRERADWRAWRGRLPVPFATYHRNDQAESIRIASGGRVPVVVAETRGGDVVVLLGPEGLERCGGSPERLVEAVERASIDAGLTWPSV